MATPTSATTATAAGARVWIRYSTPMPRTEPCVFGKSMFDTLLCSSGEDTRDSQQQQQQQYQQQQYHHYDRQVVSLREDWSSKSHGYRVVLQAKQENDVDDTATPPTQMDSNSNPNKNPNKDHRLPFGRARLCPALGSTDCPTTIKPLPDNPKRPVPRLAVVGLVLNHTGSHVLMTRRPNYMRSFPGAWVLPGGGIDPKTDASLTDALKREVWEETGLELNTKGMQMQPICLWESVYPTTPDHPGPIQAHHLVVFWQGIVASSSSKEEETATTATATAPSLTLQEEEVTSALWLSVKDFKQVLERTMSNHHANDHSSQQSSSLPTTTVYQSNGSTLELSLDTLVGIYPQPESDTERTQQEWCGIAQGSLFALQELLSRATTTTSSTTATTPLSSNQDGGGVDDPLPIASLWVPRTLSSI